ncbi:MAG: hypothetical protein WC496_02845 [Phycisphaerae bacterium]
MTIDSVKRVRDLLGVNLVEPEAGEPPLLTRLGTDEILLCDVVYCLIKPQADQLGVTDSDFGRSLGGDAILAVQTALYEELIDFFQKRGRPDRAKAASAQKEMIELAVERVKMKLEAMNPKVELNRILGN